ncbi:MAG: hypothetical protein Edafosvirus4_39 [Edafosvirus sp.]|uniref:Myristylated IMV envelope protein n=1 Tax=Edafosvirus sp. TaxID=2487765 RepID=A0A3G4ZT45_9VIRU|nr:MAG: hypothetical protein Edafosvirus4_39 [Edafosvirus sp.]
MGASASTSIANVTNEYEKNLNSKCTARNYVDQSINGLDIATTNYGCDIIIENVAMADADCQNETMVDTLTKAALANDAAAKAGFGISVSTAVSDYKNKIKETIDAQCNSENNIRQNISNLKLHLENKEGNKCGVLKVANTARAKANCALGIYSKSVDEIDAKTKAESSGFVLDTSTIISICLVIICCCIICCVISSAAGMLGSGGAGGESGSSSADIELTPLTFDKD